MNLDAMFNKKFNKAIKSKKEDGSSKKKPPVSKMSQQLEKFVSKKIAAIAEYNRPEKDSIEESSESVESNNSFIEKSVNSPVIQKPVRAPV